MKKNRLFRVSCIAIIVCLVISLIPSTLFATEANNQQITTAQKIAYFDEKTVLTCGQSFINETISLGRATSWTKDTKISQITKLYDTDYNVNAYVLNLKTNDKATGYLLVEAFTSSKPNVVQYGFSGVYYLTNDKYFKNLKEKKIIYLGNNSFCIESNGQYYDAENNKKLSVPNFDVKYNYLN